MGWVTAEKKVLALVALIRRVETGASLSSAEIAAEFGVDRRTAQRWLGDLQRFVPLEEYKRGRYRRQRYDAAA